MKGRGMLEIKVNQLIKLISYTVAVLPGGEFLVSGRFTRLEFKIRRPHIKIWS